jgi:hypothetical protein
VIFYQSKEACQALPRFPTLPTSKWTVDQDHPQDYGKMLIDVIGGPSRSTFVLEPRKCRRISR